MKWKVGGVFSTSGRMIWKLKQRVDSRFILTEIQGTGANHHKADTSATAHWTPLYSWIAFKRVRPSKIITKFSRFGGL